VVKDLLRQLIECGLDASVSYLFVIATASGESSDTRFARTQRRSNPRR
jgi:hypothetical protein